MESYDEPDLVNVSVEAHNTSFRMSPDSELLTSQNLDNVTVWSYRKFKSAKSYEIKRGTVIRLGPGNIQSVVYTTQAWVDDNKAVQLMDDTHFVGNEVVVPCYIDNDEFIDKKTGKMGHKNIIILPGGNTRAVLSMMRGRRVHFRVIGAYDPTVCNRKDLRSLRKLANKYQPISEIALKDKR